MPGALSWLCSDHFVNGEKSNDSTSPAFVPSLFAYVASPLKGRGERDMARYQECRRLRNEGLR